MIQKSYLAVANNLRGNLREFHPQVEYEITHYTLCVTRCIYYNTNIDKFQHIFLISIIFHYFPVLEGNDRFS